MEKLFRAVGQTPKKQGILRPLHEFLEEQQEPFLLENYLLDRQYSSKRIHSYSNGDFSRESYGDLPKLVARPKKQHMQNPDCLQDNGAEHSLWPWSSACCFLEMNQSQNKKRRRVYGGKIRSNNLDILSYSEEYHVEELNINAKRLKFTVQEGKATELTKRESTEDLNMENLCASILINEASVIQCAKVFSSDKKKKIDKAEKSKESKAEKVVKCSLFKSILRKLTPTKGLLPNIHTDLGNVSKKLFNAKTKPSCRTSKDELCRDDQTQFCVSDIVCCDSFKEAPRNGNDRSCSLGKECILSESAIFPVLMDVDSFYAKGGRDLLQLSDEISQELDVDSQDKKVKLQAAIRGSNSQSLDFSSTSISLFESCFDSDMGSTSEDKLSSNNSFQESVRAEFHPSQGIDRCVLEAACTSDHLSLYSDEYQVKDCQPGPSYGLDQSSWATTACDSMNDCHELLHSSDDSLTQDNFLSPTPTLKSFSVLQKSGHKENPVMFSGCPREDDLRSGEINGSSQEDEDEKNVYSADGFREHNRDVHSQGENVEYALEIGYCVENKQLSPVSVLETPFEESASSIDKSVVFTHITEFQLLQRFTKYSQHSSKDPSTSEQTEPGKDPSQSESRKFSIWNQDSIDGIQMSNLINISSQRSIVQCQKEMGCEQGGTDEYVRKVLNSPEMLSCLRGLNQRDSQGLTCFQLFSHAGDPLSSQYLNRKEMPMQTSKLLFDCVKEILESPRKEFYSGDLEQSLLKECPVPEQLAKEICDQIYSWTETDANAEETMVELTWKKEAEDWTMFREEAEDIGIEIEVDIFGLLMEELVADLARLQP
ncbi:hypothetical protein KI387_029229 [Taxus chinensis]|uniref:DUF4378 domain-containing protein n=1 Tax=Taxus chinensis TaxID=29808 RepID=A0AA38CHS9_TAXCH|nr:hypothetical protein KI387_029229 [Taxus chinensis]